jgi:drug/metabolite transporter (DMT)-like permease
MRGVSSSGNFLMIVGLQMLVGSLTLWVPAMMLETPTIVWTNAFVYAFIYTTLVPGLLATLVWFILVDRIGAVRASTYHFLNPFFGVAIAAAILREGLSPLDILGVAIVAGGILAVQLAKRS